MLAEYLTQLRQRAQLTPSQWADRAGISRSTLWRWEQGKTLPRDEELRYALDALSAAPVERTRAGDFLRQERAARGILPPPTLTGAGLNRNELLRALRLRRGWSQREAAELLGVNRVTLATWEAGDHWPDASLLHRLCQMYGASPEELLALTTLPVPTRQEIPSDPADVTWDDIETYQGDFGELELRYLTNRAQLARMPQDPAREREIACTLDYLHFLSLQGRSGEARRALRRLASHPAILASPTLFTRHKWLYAIEQKMNPQGNPIAEKTLRLVSDLGDAVPLAERARIRAEWSLRRRFQGDFVTALRLSIEMRRDVEKSGDPHLLAISQREHTACLIDVGQFSDAAKALEDFPTHTPLFAVQKVLTYAMLTHNAGSRSEARAAYEETAKVAQAAGMSDYATYCVNLAASLTDP